MAVSELAQIFFIFLYDLQICRVYVCGCSISIFVRFR